MTAYHLHEWVWGDWLKTDHETWKKIGGIRDDRSFKARLGELWPAMTVIEELTNGTKHFRQHDRLENPSAETERVAGYGRGPYGVGPYGQPYLLIDFGSDCSPRYQTAEQLIDDAVAFWRGLFNLYFNQNRDPVTC
jgi:hypothetical protein